MERERARRLIEHLRAGVPSLEVAELLSQGRGRLMGEIEADLAALAAGRPRPGRIVAGNYGDGKTHTLSAIQALASRQGFLVSVFTASRESPLDRPDRVYRKLLRRTYAPGVSRPGIELLLRRIGEKPELVQRLLRFCEQNLHPKLALVLEASLEGEFGASEELERDLAGYLLTAAEARRAYQTALGRRAPKIENFHSQHALSYLRLLDELSTLAGYAGWVLLLDEIELLGRLGRLGRARSYALLGELWDQKSFPHTYAVAAVAASFQTDLTDRLKDMERLPDWLAQHNHPELREAVQPVVRRLLEAPHLAALTEEDLAGVFQAIVAAHADAFAWTPPLDGGELLRALRVPLRERDTKVRQLVRAAVHYLDLYRRCGRAPELAVQGIAEVAVHYEEEPPEGEAVRRDWPD